MRKVLLCFAIISSLLLFAPKTFAEEIRDFSVDININKDGTIDVVESIEYDFGGLRRHGIFREIPFVKETGNEGNQGNWGNRGSKKYELDFEILGVEDESGQSYRFAESREGEKIRLKIGDPDTKITGIHTYIIRYKVAGALTYFSDHDELYWNVTGNEWEVLIQRVSALVRLPERVPEQNLKATCFTGSFGSKLQGCMSAITDDQVQFSAFAGLLPSHGLTVVVGWPKGIVAALEPEPYKTFWETIWGLGILGLLGILGIFWYLVYPLKIVYKWFKYGRDPEVGTPVRAWFDPPKLPDGRVLTPGEVGTLLDETAHLKDISATIVDLARKGYLRIEERKKKDFWFVKQKEYIDDKNMLPFEYELLKGIFRKKDEVRLKNKKLYATVVATKRQLYKRLVNEDLFPKDPDSIRKYYTFITIMAFVTLNIFLGIIALIFGRSMPRKTKAGAEAARIATSLKNFLASQERQIGFAVEKGQEQVMFEELLPYAVAFGVEKIWAERFEGLDMQEPEWYRGYREDRFNSVILANSLSNSFSGVAKAASPSSTSSSGFSSGFSSGGFSGGGGGGGGGGSW